jgi:hypothetical protein
MEGEIYQILKNHKLSLKKREEVLADLLLLLDEEQDKKMYSEEDMKQYAIFCIRCYEQGLPCIIAKDWFEKWNNKQQIT